MTITVVICICTYKRYDNLKILLKNLTSIAQPDACQIHILIVDNDSSGSASGIQEDFKEVKYFIEADKGVSYARNRAVSVAKRLNPDLIAFLDDDEIPGQNWLVDMLSTLTAHNADIVAGPVVPSLPADLSDFLPFMTRKRHPTGTPIKYWGAGNVLLRAEVFDQIGFFSEHYSEIGGEDTQFSARCSRQGLHMVWSDAAVVVEPTDATRANPTWLAGRAFANGRILVRVERELGMLDLKRRTVVALLRLMIGVLGWPSAYLADRICKTHYKLACLISFKKGTGMLAELIRRSNPV